MDIDIPGQTLKLQEFDIKTLIKDNDGTYIHPRIVMIAPSGSGKSWIVRNILYEMRDIPCGVVLAPTDKMNNSNSSLYPVFYQMRLYNRALSAAEIQQNFNALRGRFGI